ncbi:MAG: hypothetical protein ACR2MM_05715 [Flavobacteriaceae bacterium]
MRKKVDFDKWSSPQLEKQVKNLKFGTGLLAGLLIVLFGVALYLSIAEKRFHPVLVTPIALSVIIPLNFKRIKSINKEIERRNDPGTDRD